MMSMVLESITAGMAKITMNAVVTSDHTNMGMRLSDIPGARILYTVVTISTATARPESSVKVIICAQKSARLPGV
jgi:hypothetical protein